jgi:hypothetical protein
MLRTLRARVGILSLARPPLRVHSAIRQNGYPIERVRYKKPGLRPKYAFPTRDNEAAADNLLLGLYWVVSWL